MGEKQRKTSLKEQCKEEYISFELYTNPCLARPP